MGVLCRDLSEKWKREEWMNRTSRTIEKIFRFCLWTLVAVLHSGNIVAQRYKIYADFPAGNVVVSKISNDTVWISPDLRDTNGNWFYWCFGVSHAKGKCLQFILTKPNCLPAKGPSCSIDKGLKWDWVDPNATWDSAFSYRFTSDEEVRFSMGMPYTQVNLQKFMAPHLKSGLVSMDTLATSKEGRAIERLCIKPAESEFKVLVTARHHACEMMANYEIEGMIEAISKDRWLREHVEFCFIPFVDKDGVENGDQGKNRRPRDHNRDYSGKSIYPSTAALRSWVPAWSENKLALSLDLHCPWIKGDNNENIYIVGSSDKNIAEQQARFGDILKNVNDGELKISDRVLLPFDTAWNNAANFSDGYSISKWISTVEGVKLSISLEFPYSSNEGQTITQGNARQFGADIARAVKVYLKQL